MKQLSVVFLSALILLTGCKSWDATMITAKKEPISPKLLTLDRRIEDLAVTTVIATEDEVKLFTKEVEGNLIDPYGDKYGYIAFKRNTIKERYGLGFWCINAVGLFTPMLLGVPFTRPEFKIEVELRIMDRNDKLLAKYSAIGTGKNYVACYYGYSWGKAPRKSYVDALNDAFSQIRPQIQADAAKINEKLRAAGRIM